MKKDPAHMDTAELRAHDERMADVGEDALELVRRIARMNYDGEEYIADTDGVGGDIFATFVMENDDAVATLNALIEEAREIVKEIDQ